MNSTRNETLEAALWLFALCLIVTGWVGGYGCALLVRVP